VYRPPDNDTVVLEIQPWITGFVLKEYGHVDPHDRDDIAQEGCLSLLQIVKKLGEQTPRFATKDEYLFYVKAVVRNAIRDYILKLRSRFDISLYKLRRELKCECPGRPKHHLESCTKRELGEFMTDVGNEFAETQGITRPRRRGDTRPHRLSGTGMTGSALSDYEAEAEDPREWETRQRRLSLLSGIHKSGRGMNVTECQSILGKVLQEYRRYLHDENLWNFQTPTSRSAPLTPEAMKTPPVNLPHARTPLVSGVPSKSRIVKCANRFCNTDLRLIRVPLVHRGFAYCSKTCRKEWPPIVVRLQSRYEVPIEVILEVSLKLFRSKRRTAEILDIAGSTMERLVTRFGIGE